MSLNITALCVLHSGSSRRVLRGALYDHTPSGPTPLVFTDDQGRTVTIGPKDTLAIHSLTVGSNSSGGDTLVLGGNAGLLTVDVAQHATRWLDLSSAPIFLPKGQALNTIAPDTFTPASLPGLWSWWDFSDDANLTLTGSEITGADDLSGNSRNLSKATTGVLTGPANTGAIGGVQAAAFSSGAIGSAYTTNDIDLGIVWVFCVHEVITTGSSDVVVSTRDDTGQAWQVANRATVRLNYGLTSITGGIEEHVVTAGAPVIRANRFDMRTSGTTLVAPSTEIAQSWLNGDDYRHDTYDAGTSWDPTNAIVGVGGNPDLTAEIATDIGEVVIYKGDLTTLQRQQMEGYLAHRWNQESSLPGGHPYKAAPP